VTSGPTLFNTSYDNLDEHLKFKAFANEAVPVYFFNKGADCHLLMGAPTIRAARKIPVTDSSSTTNLSFPFTANERRLLIVHDEKIEALFVVIKPSAVLGHPCDPSATPRPSPRPTSFDATSITSASIRAWATSWRTLGRPGSRGTELSERARY
jgi:hypothetical protein